jgi:HK97 family phage major capsid protein
MTLSELRNVLEQKRGELADLCQKHRGADGQYDMPVEVVEQFNARNDELSDLQVKFDASQKAANAALENEKALAASREVKRPGFSGSGEQPGQKVERKSAGQQFVESAVYKAARQSGGGHRHQPHVADVDLKTLMSTTAGWDPEDTRREGVLLTALQQPRVLDLVGKSSTDQSTVLYMEETTHTNNAAEVAEAGTYGEAALAFTERSSEVRKTGVWIPVTDEQLEDVSRIQSLIDNRLRTMLMKRLDSQLLVGNGTAPNLRGVNNVSSILTQAKGADPVFDAFYKAIVQINTNAFEDPDGIVVNPSDWQDVRLTRTTDGVYIMGNPDMAGPQRLFGLPVVLTTHQTAGTGLVGCWSAHSDLVSRRGIEVQITNAHSTYFIEGKQALRMDMRCAFIVDRASAFCQVTGI